MALKKRAKQINPARIRISVSIILFSSISQMKCPGWAEMCRELIYNGMQMLGWLSSLLTPYQNEKGFIKMKIRWVR